MWDGFLHSFNISTILTQRPTCILPMILKVWYTKGFLSSKMTEILDLMMSKAKQKWNVHSDCGNQNAQTAF